MSRDSLRKKLEAAGVLPAGTGPNGYPLFRLRDVLGCIYRVENDPDRMDPFSRDAWYRGERNRLDAMRRRGELLEAHDVRRTYAAFCQIVARELELLPDVLERDTGLQGSAIDVAEACVDRIRSQLAETLRAELIHDEDQCNGQ